VTAELFVYGTLAPGEVSWPLLAPHVVESRPNAVPGVLYDTRRGYPGAVFGPGTELVHGWSCTLTDPPGEALEMLDAFEGDEYERIIVRCCDGTEALTYHWIATLDGLVPMRGGNWSMAR
jgi:gamma-glutamylcyclotransferase (GGCT)/AIG2-like uncharacterized protein YtfP